MQEKTERIEMRTSLLRIVDTWRRKQRDHPSRSVAIGRLVERGLERGATTAAQRSKGTGRKAAEMAGSELDRLGIRLRPMRNAHGESVGLSRARGNFVRCEKAPSGLRERRDGAKASRRRRRATELRSNDCGSSRVSVLVPSERCLRLTARRNEWIGLDTTLAVLIKARS